MSKQHLILVPGLLCDEAVWEYQCRELQDLAEITIADHGSRDSFDEMAAAILDRAPQQFAIAGHSMGGRVVFQVFNKVPERITGMALLDTAFTPKAHGILGEQETEQRYRLLEIARQSGMRCMGEKWAKPMVHPDRVCDGELMNAILDMIERKSANTFAAQIKALLERPDATSVLARIRCPALVLCGRQDSWSGLSHHQEMAARIANSRLVVIENCGHMSTMERPAEVTAAMREWLGKLGAGL